MSERVVRFAGPIRGASFCFNDQAWTGFRSTLASALDIRSQVLKRQVIRVLEGKQPNPKMDYAHRAIPYAAFISVLAWACRLGGNRQAGVEKRIAGRLVKPTPAAWTKITLDNAQVSLDLGKKTSTFVVSEGADGEGECVLLDAYIDALSAVCFNHSSGGAFLFEGRKLIDVGWQKGRKKFDVRAILREPYRMIPAPSAASVST